jgi:hypothetical protein
VTQRPLTIVILIMTAGELSLARLLVSPGLTAQAGVDGGGGGTSGTASGQPAVPGSKQAAHAPHTTMRPTATPLRGQPVQHRRRSAAPSHRVCPWWATTVVLVSSAAGWQPVPSCQVQCDAAVEATKAGMLACHAAAAQQASCTPGVVVGSFTSAPHPLLGASAARSYGDRYSAPTGSCQCPDGCQVRPSSVLRSRWLVTCVDAYKCSE